MWRRWQELLPVPASARDVSLGEGGTPLVGADRLAGALGLRRVWLKLEGCNPTGSFKDRQVSVALGVAIRSGARGVATVSSGNAGVSVATYARRSGLESWVWIGPATAQAKIEQMLLAGAHVLRFAAVERYRESYKQLARVAAEWRLSPMITARRVNPYITEGGKTVAYEVAEQLDWQLPDWVAVPVGGGGLIGGMAKGFSELEALGWTSRRTRLLAGAIDVRDRGAHAFDGSPFGGLDAEWAARAIETTNGAAFALTHDEVARAQELLAETEGIYTEPQSAMGLAGLIRAVEAARVAKDDGVVVILTGHGLKDRDGAARLAGRLAAAKLRTVSMLEDANDEIMAARP
jgi:threonine synthase